MNKQPYEQNGRDERIAALLKAGLKDQASLSGEIFTSRVMNRIHALEAPVPFVFPAFLWAMPVVLAALIGLVVLAGVKNEEKTERTTVEDVLLADMPVEAQNMLNRSGIFWNPAQGGLWP